MGHDILAPLHPCFLAKFGMLACDNSNLDVKTPCLVCGNSILDD